MKYEGINWKSRFKSRYFSFLNLGKEKSQKKKDLFTLGKMKSKLTTHKNNQDFQNIKVKFWVLKNILNYSLIATYNTTNNRSLCISVNSKLLKDLLLLLIICLIKVTLCKVIEDLLNCCLSHTIRCDI